LQLIHDTVLCLIHIFENVCEALEELFMLLQLEIKNQLLKICIEQLALILHAHHLHDFVPGHALGRTCIDLF